MIRPEAVQLGTGPDTVAAVVHSVRPEGAFTALVADTAAGPVHVLLSARHTTCSVGACPAAPARRASLGGPPAGLSAFPVVLRQRE